ncbi:MAG: hypothetical protein QOG39_1298, partial [Acidimicrobiaceae bacterium]
DVWYLELEEPDVDDDSDDFQRGL